MTGPGAAKRPALPPVGKADIHARPVRNACHGAPAASPAAQHCRKPPARHAHHCRADVLMTSRRPMGYVCNGARVGGGNAFAPKPGRPRRGRRSRHAPRFQPYAFRMRSIRLPYRKSLSYQPVAPIRGARCAALTSPQYSARNGGCDAAGARLRRHQDRGHRARPRRRRARPRPRPRPRASTTTAASGPSALCSSASRPSAGGRIETVGIGVPGSVDRATGRVSQGQLHLAARPRPAGRPRRRPRPAGENRQRRQLLRALRGGRRRRRRRAGGLRRHPRHRRRRRRRRARPPGRGRQRHRRRMGPHPAAAPARRRAPGPDLLLRRRRPHRGLALRPEPRRRLRPPRRRPGRGRAEGRRDRRARRRRRRRSPRRPCAATRTASAARSRSSSTCSTPTSSSSAAASPTSPASTRTCRRLIEPHVFGDKFNTRLVPNLHGDSSGVRGAAWL